MWWCSGGVGSSLRLARPGLACPESLPLVDAVPVRGSTYVPVGQATGRELHGMGYTAAEYLPLSLRRRPAWYLATFFARMTRSVPCTSPHWAFPI